MRSIGTHILYLIFIVHLIRNSEKCSVTCLSKLQNPSDDAFSKAATNKIIVQSSSDNPRLISSYGNIQEEGNLIANLRELLLTGK